MPDIEVQFSLPEKLCEWLMEYANRSARNPHEVMEEALREYLDRVAPGYNPEPG